MYMYVYVHTCCDPSANLAGLLANWQWVSTERRSAQSTSERGGCCSRAEGPSEASSGPGTKMNRARCRRTGKRPSSSYGETRTRSTLPLLLLLLLRLLG